MLFNDSLSTSEVMKRDLHAIGIEAFIWKFESCVAQLLTACTLLATPFNMDPYTRVANVS
jgi:hypothetical protein